MDFSEFEDGLRKAEALIDENNWEDAANLGIQLSSAVMSRYSEGLLSSADSVEALYKILHVIDPDYLNLKYPPFELGLFYFYLSLYASKLEIVGADLEKEAVLIADAIGWSRARIGSYIIYLSTEDEDQRLEKLRTQLEEDPGAWYYIGQIHYGRSELDEAEEAFNRVPKDDPNYSEGMWSMGTEFENGSWFAIALDYFERALKADPSNGHFQKACKRNQIKMELQTSVDEFGFNEDTIATIYESIDIAFDGPQGNYTTKAKIEPTPKASVDDERNSRYIAEHFQNNAEFQKTLIEQAKAEIVSKLEDIKNSQDTGFSDLTKQLDDSIGQVIDALYEQEKQSIDFEDNLFIQCEKTLSSELSIWKSLKKTSQEFLVSADYFSKQSTGVERIDHSGAAIGLCKALESELLYILYDPFIESAENQASAREYRGIFKNNRDGLMIGNYTKAFMNNMGKAFLSKFSSAYFSDRGKYVLNSFPQRLEEVNEIRCGVAHRKKITMSHVQRLRKLVLEILTKLHELKVG